MSFLLSWRIKKNACRCALTGDQEYTPHMNWEFGKIMRLKKIRLKKDSQSKGEPYFLFVELLLCLVASVVKLLAKLYLLPTKQKS